MSENETIIVLDVPVRDIDRIEVNLDMLKNQDLVDLESGRFKLILGVFDRLVSVPGHDVRELHYSTLAPIVAAIRKAVEGEQNPVVQGKN